LALRGFRQGDKVKAIIRSIDTAARRISFGLKPSYFSRKEADGDDTGSQPENFNASDAEAEGELDSEAGVDNEAGLGSDSGDSHDDDDEIRIDLDTTSHFFRSRQSPNAPKPAPVAPLEIEGGFRWSGGPVTSDTEARSAPSSEESDGGEQRLKKRKKRRTQIEQDLTADMQTRTPESNADFDRLLLGSPNSSYLWVQYMSFQLRLAEVDKAREIGRRALETINFREEQEKLNVWIAFLNLENVYGSDATLEETFQDAARHNDSKTIHLRLANIFDQTEKYGVSVSPAER
jgi:rRNA biogenesis protein RRP5